MNSLLQIAPPDPAFPRELLNAAGGFLWWYLEVVDQEGHGLVLIWSFGLPFLPGYASEARRGAPQMPAHRPSLNVSIYRDGKIAFYSLQEFTPADVEWRNDPDGETTWRFGDSTFTSTSPQGERLVGASLDIAIPGERHTRLTGSVEMAGPGRAVGQAIPRNGKLRHKWAPMTGPARGVVDLSAGPQRYAFEGRGYFDGNYGAEPLHDAGFADWFWGRAPLPDHERIYYALRRRDTDAHDVTGIEIDRDGQMIRRDLEIASLRWTRSRAGTRFPKALELTCRGEPWLRTRATTVLDDGPFYVRHWAQHTEPTGVMRSGLAEGCSVDDIDRALHRPLVKMRVEQRGRRNSIWLPLFTGPREGRIGRLLHHALRRSRRT